MSLSQHRCQLCGQGPLERFEVPESTVLYYCRDCELYQDGRMVARAAYEASYHDGYDRHRPQKLRTARLRTARIARMLEVSANPRLLEIGCSVGATLEVATQRGWDAVGVDVAETAIARCRKAGLEALLVGPLVLPFADESFDVVCAWHVIEHVESVEKTLKEWARVLRPGGLLVIETPDANCRKAKRLGARYRKFWAPEHTYTFSRSSLQKFFERAGLEVEAMPSWISGRGLSAVDRLYACGYGLYHSGRQVAGVEKAFQLVGRKPRLAAHALRPAA